MGCSRQNSEAAAVHWLSVAREPTSVDADATPRRQSGTALRRCSISRTVSAETVAGQTRAIHRRDLWTPVRAQKMNRCDPTTRASALARLVRPSRTERLSRLDDGRLLYRLKHRWRDGTTHVVFTPQELVEKLAALVPPPRFHLVRYHGVLGPCASERDRVVPVGEGVLLARSSSSLGAVATPPRSMLLPRAQRSLRRRSMPRSRGSGRRPRPSGSGALHPSRSPAPAHQLSPRAPARDGSRGQS